MARKTCLENITHHCHKQAWLIASGFTYLSSCKCILAHFILAIPCFPLSSVSVMSLHWSIKQLSSMWGNNYMVTAIHEHTFDNFRWTYFDHEVYWLRSNVLQWKEQIKWTLLVSFLLACWDISLSENKQLRLHRIISLSDNEATHTSWFIKILRFIPFIHC